jgi:hypothetical protein
MSKRHIFAAALGTAVVAATVALAVVASAFLQGRTDGGRLTAGGHTVAAGHHWGDRLAAKCAAAPVSAGFHQVRLTRPLLIQYAFVTITVPCEIHMSGRARLTIYRSVIRSGSLVVVDDAPGGPSPVTVIGSSLSSTDGGLLVRLQHSGDNILIIGSRISYPLSVWFATQDEDRTGHNGMINVVSSIVISKGSSSEGIMLMSAGRGNFFHNFFKTSQQPGLALLFAHECHMKGNIGAVPRCSV